MSVSVAAETCLYTPCTPQSYGVYMVLKVMVRLGRGLLHKENPSEILTLQLDHFARVISQVLTFAARSLTQLRHPVAPRPQQAGRGLGVHRVSVGHRLSVLRTQDCTLNPEFCSQTF